MFSSIIYFSYKTNTPLAPHPHLTQQMQQGWDTMLGGQFAILSSSTILISVIINLPHHLSSKISNLALGSVENTEKKIIEKNWHHIRYKFSLTWLVKENPQEKKRSRKQAKKLEVGPTGKIFAQSCTKNGRGLCWAFNNYSFLYI